MRISDWSSDVCSSDLAQPLAKWPTASSFSLVRSASVEPKDSSIISFSRPVGFCPAGARLDQKKLWFHTCPALLNRPLSPLRSEEHTSELQSLMRISYAVFCLKKKTN